MIEKDEDISREVDEPNWHVFVDHLYGSSLWMAMKSLLRAEPRNVSALHVCFHSLRTALSLSLSLSLSLVSSVVCRNFAQSQRYVLLSSADCILNVSRYRQLFKRRKCKSPTSAATLFLSRTGRDTRRSDKRVLNAERRNASIGMRISA